mmetsp:Transcript_126026/g.251582  ORF Transcript_126026/g.251582 Transcript_126026/m.251582 type:complete len:205 (+) Transcript_126026:30-644(+)
MAPRMSRSSAKMRFRLCRLFFGGAVSRLRGICLCVFAPPLVYSAFSFVCPQPRNAAARGALLGPGSREQPLTRRRAGGVVEEASLSKLCGATGADTSSDKCLDKFKDIGSKTSEVSVMAGKVQGALPGYNGGSFAGIDADANGFVDKAEFVMSFKNLGLGLSDFFVENVLFFIGDADRNGVISPAELEQFVRTGEVYAKQLAGR